MARFFSSLGSVQFFQFQAYKTKTKPIGFFKILIDLISFFHGLIFSIIFFYLISFSTHP
jgi:type IV secretory pathway VirB6-like protein